MTSFPSNTWGNIDSPWIAIPIETWNILIQNRPTLKFAAGHDIYWEEKAHDSIYILAKGRVSISVSQDNGQYRQLYIACKGAMFGETACILGQPHNTSATTITAVELYCIPSKEVQRIFHSDYHFSEYLLQYEARKTRMFIALATTQSFDKAIQRIAKNLLYLSETYGEEESNGHIRIALHFTCEEVAYIVNTSRVTVNNTFSRLYRDDILYKKNGYYFIKDLPKLKQITSSNFNT